MTEKKTKNPSRQNRITQTCTAETHQL